jgi:hypothetical protein
MRGHAARLASNTTDVLLNCRNNLDDSLVSFSCLSLLGCLASGQTFTHFHFLPAVSSRAPAHVLKMPSMYSISMTAESMPAGKSHGILPHDGRCDPTVRQSSLPVCRCRYGRRGATSMHQPGEFTDTIACKLHINQVVRAAFPLPNVLLAGAGRDAVHCLPPKTPLLLFVGWRRFCAGTFSFCVK